MAAMAILAPASAQTATEQPIIYLNQAWSQDDRDWYYNFSQGSAVIPYDIFLNLEVADSQELFRSNSNSDRFGLIPQNAGPNNPDGLPIGISKTTVATPIGAWSAGDYVGLNCAACHQAQLNYKGKRIRIDGGASNTFDMQAYVKALTAAMTSTLNDAAKFDRLAVRLGATSADAKAKLRQRFDREESAIRQYATRDTATYWP